jgi:hypothetical protein
LDAVEARGVVALDSSLRSERQSEKNFIFRGFKNPKPKTQNPKPRNRDAFGVGISHASRVGTAGGGVAFVAA